ncbi:hypothetical protein BKP64_04635 [Marinobacter salinus]|uniref:Glycosyltransferase 2-like domain-containing protein n=1 Tax=Marinobacter salinus TaxID=1874317 RepID=A0A1D9GJ51_9GAMM|nr:glycosyltransferase [Marinobacter salinus]AOY87515.1 hypothetical protein BKP64_04635 [Marinobacter salinus]
MSKDSLPSVSVIIPAYNEERYIEQALIALRKTDYPNSLIEIIVVDNGSSDNTLHIAQRYSDQVLCLKKGNVGAVRNLGARYATAEILIFLDADCLIDSSWISRGVRLLKNNENTVYGGPCKTRQNPNWIEKLWLLENPKYPRLQPDLLGSCIFIHKQNFQSINGFNEEMTSGEDSDLSERLRKNGASVKIDRALAVVHLGNPQSLKEFFSRQVWHSENYLRFLNNSISDYMFWIVILFIISILLIIFGIILLNCTTIIIGFSSITLLTVALSAKRILLTRYFPQNISEIAGILILDFFYLSARSKGLIKPIINKKF